MEKLSIRIARTRRRLEQHRLYRLLGGRGAVTLLLGAALSLGGISEAIDGVHFVVEKDLDAVRVVRQRAQRADVVVAKVNDGFAANTVFKLAQVLPDRLVSREHELFSSTWMPHQLDLQQQAGEPAKKRDVFHEEMARINDAIREQFFANAVPFGDLIHEKSKKYDVDPALVAAVIEQESRFRSKARSHVGAQGLMQLMPRTGRWMGARNLYDPAQNVDAGVKYIKYLSVKYDGNLKKTIAAYNAGEGNVARYNGVPPFRETQTYVRKVLHNLEKRNNQMRQYGAAGAREAENLPEPGALTLR
jgi:soluble lytic murein transglycosylase-like protein